MSRSKVTAVPAVAAPVSKRVTSCVPNRWSSCCALMAAQAEGFGAQWLTGWPAYDAKILALLGLGPDERIAGFIHVGTPKLEAPERERPDPLALLGDWSPA